MHDGGAFGISLPMVSQRIAERGEFTDGVNDKEHERPAKRELYREMEDLHKLMADRSAPVYFVCI